MAKKEPKSIAQQLRERKYTPANNIEWLAYAFLSNLPFFAPKYKVNYQIIDDPKLCKGPCFIIWNHQSRRDYLFLKKIIAPMKFNMVAGYSEFSRQKFAWLFKHAHVLPKKNFTNDPVGIRAITSIIKQGGCVAFSPEGTSSIYGCQQPIVPGTGRFLQFFKVPVYFMHLEGAYLTSHKVCIDDRIGKINASIRLLFSPEDLSSMTPAQIDDKINEVFWHDDYEWNKTARVKYKTKEQPCKNLDDLIYKCPKCGGEMCITAEGNTIKCNKCGNGATMNDYYDMIPFNKDCKVPVSPSAWYAYQRIEIIKEIRKDPNYSYTIDVKVGELPKYKPIKNNKLIALPCGEGKMTFDHQGIHFRGKKHGEDWSFDLSYQVYYSLVIENECSDFALYVNDEMYDFICNKTMGKAMLVTEEMHRLHVNNWKNFSWNSYMYHGTELAVDNDDFEKKYNELFIK